MKKKVYIGIVTILLFGVGTIFVLTNNTDNLKESSNETCSAQEATSCSIESVNKNECSSCSQQCDHDCPYFKEEVAGNNTGCNGHCSGHKK